MEIKPATPQDRRPKIGISSCLLGEQVRYDGSGKEDRWVSRELSRFVDFVPMCPEMTMGFSAPREAMRLVQGDDREQKVVLSKSEVDVTDRAKKAVTTLMPAVAGLDAYILMNKSPSCGLERVKVYQNNGIPTNDGAGFFAKALQQHYPNLLLIERGRLCDPVQRDHFLVQLFSRIRFRDVIDGNETLQNFHRRHKFLLLSHDPTRYQDMGRIAATSHRSEAYAEARDQYRDSLYKALETAPTKGKILNSLQHIVGFLKASMDTHERSHIEETLLEFTRSKFTRRTPLSLLQMLSRSFDQAYIQDQVVFSPYPRELQSEGAVL